MVSLVIVDFIKLCISSMVADKLMHHIKKAKSTGTFVMGSITTLVLIIVTGLTNPTLAAMYVQQSKLVVNDNTINSNSINKRNLNFNDTTSTVNIINNTGFNPNIINNTSSSGSGVGLDSNPSSHSGSPTSSNTHTHHLHHDNNNANH